MLLFFCCWCVCVCVCVCVYSCYTAPPHRYTKPKGQLPDYESPVVLKTDKCSVEDFCNAIHRNIIKEFK